ncbi:MAG: hypothetical protein ACREUG_04690, partial [Steroidobacteraceae bacterium]
MRRRPSDLAWTEALCEARGIRSAADGSESRRSADDAEPRGEAAAGEPRAGSGRDEAWAGAAPHQTGNAWMRPWP